MAHENYSPVFTRIEDPSLAGNAKSSETGANGERSGETRVNSGEHPNKTSAPKPSNNNKYKSAIRTGIPSQRHNISRIADRFRGNISSFSISPGDSTLEIERINIEKIINLNKSLYLILNKNIQGKSLHEYLHSDFLQEEKTRIMQILIRIARNYPEHLSLDLNPHHMLLSGDSLVIIPKNWSRVLSQHEAVELSETGRHRVNYPAQQGSLPAPVLRAYSLAAVLYRLCTGHWAVEPQPTAGSGTEFGDQSATGSADVLLVTDLTRRKVFKPIEAYLPSLPEPLLQWFHSALSCATQDLNTPFEHRAQFEIQGSEPVLQVKPQSMSQSKTPLPRSPQPKRQAESERMRLWKRRLQFEQFRFACKQRILPISIACMSLIVLISISWGIISTATRNLAVTGLAATEVVQQFYTSINNLDHSFMSEAVHRRTARDIVNQISTLYAVITVREGTEQRRVFYPASEWLASEGEFDIGDNLVFGISDLRISPIAIGNAGVGTGNLGDVSADSENAGTAAAHREYQQFTAEYTLWQTINAEVISEQRSDFLRLERFPRGWKITEFLRLE